MMTYYVCRSYDVASECVSYLLYLCKDIRTTYKTRLDEFEYACSHLASKDGMLVSAIIAYYKYNTEPGLFAKNNLQRCLLLSLLNYLLPEKPDGYLMYHKTSNFRFFVTI